MGTRPARDGAPLPPVHLRPQATMGSELPAHPHLPRRPTRAGVDTPRYQRAQSLSPVAVAGGERPYRVNLSAVAVPAAHADVPLRRTRRARGPRCLRQARERQARLCAQGVRRACRTPTAYRLRAVARIDRYLPTASSIAAPKSFGILSVVGDKVLLGASSPHSGQYVSSTTSRVPSRRTNQTA